MAPIARTPRGPFNPPKANSDGIIRRDQLRLQAEALLVFVPTDLLLAGAAVGRQINLVTG